MAAINEDLQIERYKCTFNTKELTTFIDGGPERTKDRKDRESLMLRERKLFEGIPEEYLNHKERYERSIQQSVLIFSLVRRRQKEGKCNVDNYRDFIGGILDLATIRDGSPLGLHYMMFMPAITNLADEEQQKYWMGRAWNSEIIGSYAQTELGHGTFVRGLETTATYDASTQEFVLHSPTLTSYKWWPGGLGQTANYCIVIAQLHSRGQCQGVHAFMVQVRDEDTHQPLPGIKVGDIGCKLGLNSVNNGFIGFDQLRIPRRNMLMKHAQVMEDGTYLKSRDSKMNYSAMVFVRVVIVYDMANYLSRAATIATRYSAVRRQCRGNEGVPENQILDYMTQQHKLFICIAASLALRVNANKLWDIFNEISDQLVGGNLDRLPELHALACCLKAVSTSDAANFVERCRLACGGHGYMLSSNLPLLYGIATASCTYEGDNTVLLLQTARFLAKTWQQIDSTPLTPTVLYLKSAQLCADTKWENSVAGVTRGLQIVSMRKIQSCVENMTRDMMSGMSQEKAWNMTSIDLVAAAEVHCRLILISTFHEEVMKMKETASAELSIVLTQLDELYAAYYAIEKLKDLLLYTNITQQDTIDIQAWYTRLLTDIRPNAVGLVDSFDIIDEVLNSTLGAYDGRVYERLMAEALRSPLNAEPVNRSFHQYLKPFMQGKL